MVGRNFICSNTRLKNLEGAPKEVGGIFSFSNETSISLKNASVISGEFQNDGSSIIGTLKVRFKHLPWKATEKQPEKIQTKKIPLNIINKQKER